MQADLSLVVGFIAMFVLLRWIWIDYHRPGSHRL